MTYTYEFSDLTKLDIAEITDWYEGQQKSLGEKFLQSVQETIIVIQQNPLVNPLYYLQYRRQLIKKFPYKLIYKVEDSHIQIIACYHTKRDPSNWQTRI